MPSKSKRVGFAASLALAMALSSTPATAAQNKQSIQDIRAQHGYVVTNNFDERQLFGIAEQTANNKIKETEASQRVSGKDGVKLKGEQLADVYVLSNKKLNTIMPYSKPIGMVITIVCFDNKQSHSKGKPDFVKQYIVAADGTILPLAKPLGP